VFGRRRRGLLGPFNVVAGPGYSGQLSSNPAKRQIDVAKLANTTSVK
jgi:hypothetical protein